MSAALAPSAAAVRDPRAAAGRRALYAVLFLGGLVALGFLCAGQARAAELPVAPGAGIATVQGEVDGVKARVHDMAPREPGGAADRLGTSTRRVTDTVGTSTRRVTDTVGELPRPVTDTVQRVLRPVGKVAEEVDDALPVPLPPHGGPGGDHTPQAPVKQAPGKERTLPEPDRQAADSSPSPAQSHRAVPLPASSYHPAAWGQTAPGSRYDAAHPGAVKGKHEQAPHAPAGPCGDAALQAGEVKPPRPADPQAAASDGAVSALVPGAGFPAATTPLRQGPQEILEFPG
ncbi:hypothetical protein [Streptomyces sp. NPDC051219]|uniref:hypothetical protein n=1 Tax=Streptomyces sp. NPDC051219 TaxID=3155283 RepID=UPI003443CF7B